MNYSRIYQRIITSRQLNKFDGYTEQHHILPKSLGGTNELHNLVELTAREHFICHLLLTKIYTSKFENAKMVKAFMMMLVKSTNQQRYFTSHRYEKIRTEFAKIQSCNQTGKGNSQHNTRWIHSLQLKQNKKILISCNIPAGWESGRILDWAKAEQEKIKKIERVLIKDKEISTYRLWYKIYQEVGFDEFVKQTGYKFSKPNLVQRFSALLPEFVAQNGKKRYIPYNPSIVHGPGC